jgi:hypothetical protein
MNDPIKPTPPVAPKSKKTPQLIESKPYATVHGQPGVAYYQDGHHFDIKKVYVPCPN